MDFDGWIELEMLRLFGLPASALAILNGCRLRAAGTRTLSWETR